MTIALPALTSLDKLTDLTAQFVGVSIQYNPDKLRGTVHLSVRGQVTPAQLWAIYNQVLIGQGFTSVLAGLPPVYEVVPITDASGVSVTLTPDQLTGVRYPPGFEVDVIVLHHLGGDAAVKALSSLFTGQTSQIRTLGQDGHRLVIAAPRGILDQALAILQSIDQPGAAPQVVLYRPVRASPQAIQASATSAWSALGRITNQSGTAEIDIAPDGAQDILIATGDDMPALEAVVRSLDRAEPVVTRSYHPQVFGVDEVGNLLQQLLHGDHGSDAGVDIVRDHLTGTLIISATASQHAHIETVLRGLDETPPSARRQVRTFIIRNRQAEELTKVLNSLIANGVVQAQAQAAQPPPRAAGGEPATAAGAPGLAPPQLPTPQVVSPAPPQPAFPPEAASAPVRGAAGEGGDDPVVLSPDVLTNAIIAIGDPRELDQVAHLITSLDQRQSQVDLEVFVVDLSKDRTESLGVELSALIKDGNVSGSVSSLFGISAPVTGDPVARQLSGSASGQGGVVLNPGDFSGVLQALDQVTDSKTMIRSHIVVSNNAKATVDGVLEEPLVSTNTSPTGTLSSVNGTSDAGTQIAITPQISVADYLSLSYSISQSSFQGTAIISNGSVIPPTKLSYSVSSISTIPDGYVIALGGLSNRSRNRSDQHVPLLGAIPYLGALFSNTTDDDNDTRFYVFIKASILRRDTFADLRHEGDIQFDAMHLETGEPAFQPQFLK